jgi:hypothetical protein
VDIIACYTNAWRHVAQLAAWYIAWADLGLGRLVH